MNSRAIRTVTVGSMGDIAAAVRDQRARMRATHADLAAHAGVSRHFVADVERSKPSVTVDKLLSLLAVMRIRLELRPQPPRLLDDVPAAPQRRVRQRAAMRLDQMHADRASVGCLECGARVRDLRRHLAGVHAMRLTTYREKWNIPATVDLRSREAAERERGRMATRAALQGDEG